MWCRTRWAMSALALLSLAPIGHRNLFGQSPPREQQAKPPLTFDVVALDRDGRFVSTLRPDDISVTVDGKPRRVLAMRHVSRGPGAIAAASTRAGSPASVASAAEEQRTVLIVIDEVMAERADERPMLEAARAFLDGLGPKDRGAPTMWMPTTLVWPPSTSF